MLAPRLLGGIGVVQSKVLLEVAGVTSWFLVCGTETTSRSRTASRIVSIGPIGYGRLRLR